MFKYFDLQLSKWNEYSLKGLMLKLRICGHLMWRADSLEQILMLGNRGQECEQTAGGSEGSGQPGVPQLHGVAESDTTEWLNIGQESKGRVYLSESMLSRGRESRQTQVRGCPEFSVVVFSLQADYLGRRNEGAEHLCPLLVSNRPGQATGSWYLSLETSSRSEQGEV